MKGTNTVWKMVGTIYSRKGTSSEALAGCTGWGGRDSNVKHLDTINVGKPHIRYTQEAGILARLTVGEGAISRVLRGRIKEPLTHHINALSEYLRR